MPYHVKVFSPARPARLPLWALVLPVLMGQVARAEEPRAAHAAFALGAPQVQGRWEGFPGVQTLAVSDRGLIWLGGTAGLSRFDGVHFRRYTAEDHAAFGDSTPTALLGTPDAVWVGLSSGVLMRAPTGGRPRFTTAVTLPDGAVTALAIAPAGGVWAAAAHRVYRVRRDGAVAKRLDVAGPAHELAVDAAGRLWLGCKSGLYLWAPDKPEQLPRRLRAGVTKSLVIAKDGTVWAGIDRALYRTQADADPQVPRHARSYVGQALEVAGESVWVGREMAGLYRVGGAEVGLGTSDGIPDLGIAALALDPTGGLWGATSSGTLFVVRPRGVGHLGADAGLGQGPSFATNATRDQEIWFTNLGGVHLIKPQGITHGVAQRNGKIANCPRGLAVTPAASTATGAPPRRDDLWLATCDQGLMRWDGAAFETPLNAASRVQNVWARRGGGLWAAGPRGGLYRVEGDRMVTILPADECPAGRAAADCEDAILSLLESEGQWQGAAGRPVLLLGTRGRGLRMVDLAAAAGTPGEAAPLRWAPVAGLDGGVGIQALHEDAQGHLWIGTDGRGLLRLAGGQLDRLPDGGTNLPAAIYGLLEDAHARFWITSDQGIFRIARQNLEQLLSGQRPRALARHFGPSDGLPSLRCARDLVPAIALSPDGVVLVPAVSGLVGLDANAPDPAGDVTPRPFVEALWVDGTRVALPTDAQTVSWRRGHGNVALALSAPQAFAPGRLQLAARAAPGGDWIAPDHEGVVHFAGLPTGPFAMEVRLERADTGEWFVRPLLTVRLLALHELGWVRALAAGVLLVFGLIGLLVRQRQDRQRTQAIMEERRRMAQDLHDALAVSFTGIGYQLDTLSQILGDAAPPESRRVLEDARAMVRHSRQEARRSVWDIRSQSLEGRTLRAALCAVADEAARVGRAQVIVDTERLAFEPDDEHAHIFIRIAQEALVNAMAHGHAANIWIRVGTGEGVLRLDVEDDGQGISATASDGGVHFGLVGMQERAETAGGHFQVTPRAEGGTHVRVSLPVRRLKTRWWQVWARRRRAVPSSNLAADPKARGIE